MENVTFLEKEKEKIIDSLHNISNFCHQKDVLLEIEKQRYKRLQDRYVLLLKTKIGEKIYWASPAWNKYETHTITDIRIEKVENDFFGKEYFGTEQIKIFVDDNKSYYLAEHIDETLFFDKDEAYKHTNTYLSKQGEE